jgi:hypothetical protein
MPTVGWIYEDAVERFGENPYPPERNEHRDVSCPYPGCERHFKNLDDLLQHLGLDHPLNIPVLQIHSRTMLTEFSVRVAFNASDFTLLNCTACEFRCDGGTPQKVTPARLPALLAAQRSSTCELRLFNERALDNNLAIANFVASFRIPSDQALNAIDNEFSRRFAIEHPRIADVEAFRSVCPDEVAAQDYAAALGDYVIGLAIKERHPDAGVHLEFEHYKEKFAAALAVLKEFRRPVAHAVTAIINFNLNSFSVAPSARLPALKNAFCFFSAIADGNDPPVMSATAEPQSAPVCPVDITTYRILDAARRLTAERTPHPLVADDLETLSQREPLSEYDATKIRVLSAVAYARLGEMEKMERHLRALQFNYLFSKWAQPRLNLHLTHGNLASN